MTAFVGSNFLGELRSVSAFGFVSRDASTLAAMSEMMGKAKRAAGGSYA